MERNDACAATDASSARLMVVVGSDSGVRANCADGFTQCRVSGDRSVSAEEALSVALSEKPDFVVYVLPTGDGTPIPRPVLLEGGLR
jgi:hypothetical protein